MQIHTVKKGDTVFKIARKYSTSPMKIIENNELENPDRLSVGQKLLILNPTRTYTVRGSDELSKIAKRFGVKYETLLANNPYLYGKEKLYPGQILSIKYDTPRYGMACANGYCYSDIDEEKLSLALPYLTYVTIGSASRSEDKIKRIFNDKKIMQAAKGAGKKILLRVYDDGVTFPTGYAEELLAYTKNNGYDGITVAAYEAIKKAPQDFTAHLMNLKKLLMQDDLLLFCEINGNEESFIPDICDGYTVMYEKGCLEDIPSFKNGEEATFLRYANSAEPAKSYIDIPTLAYMGDEELLISEANELAYTSAQDISYDDESKICYFFYNKYRAGKKETVRVAYESLENLEAKLALVGELGFMGISFDVMKIPVEYLMLFETSFCHPPIYSDI